MYKIKQFNFFSIVILVLLTVSCGSLAPFNERKTALGSIEQAKSVEANNYAPNEFNLATSSFSEGEKLIVTNGKSSQNDQAKDNYIKADEEAKNAYQVAIIPYTEKFISQTSEEIEKAKIIKTEVARKELFDEAVTKNTQAKQKLEQKNYDQAKNDAVQALEVITRARKETLQLKEEVDLFDEELVSYVEEARENKAEAAVPDEYQELLVAHEHLRSMYQEGLYDDLIKLYPENIIFASDLLTLIEEKRILALDALLEAERVIVNTREKNKEFQQEEDTDL